MHIEVETVPDPKGHPAPQSLKFDGRNVGVANIVDRWWGGEETYFKVMDAEGNTYLLRFDVPKDTWDLLMFLSSRGAAFPELLGGRPGPRHARNGKL